MKIIAITAARSNLGKTVFSEQLLGRIDNWAACKVTICTEGAHVCPRGKKNCGACGSLKQDYEIVTDMNIIAQEEKDTARLLKAGAREVFWIKAKEPFIKDALNDALARLTDYDGVILEGNGSVKGIKPDLSVMVMPEDAKPHTYVRGMKRSARDILDKIDIFVDDARDEKILEEIASLRSQ